LLKVICLTVFTLALAGTAEATILFSAPPNQSGGSDLNAFLEGDSFVLAAPSIILQVEFWSLQADASDYSGSIYWEIDSNNSGVPGTAIDSGTPTPTGTPTGNTALGLNEFVYQWNVNTILAPGTYWLVLHNGPTNTIPSTTFYWEWSADTGNSQSQDLSVAPAWAANDAALAFELDGIVTPEPASICLMGSGLLAAWLARRKLGART
jgi:PEP-CTERM motif